MTQYYLAGESKNVYFEKNKQSMIMKTLEEKKTNLKHRQEYFTAQKAEIDFKLPIIKEQILKIQLDINSNNHQLSVFSQMIITGCKENPAA